MSKYITGAIMMSIVIFICSGITFAEDTPQEAKEKQLCEEGNSTACFKVGERFRTVELDNKSALPYFQKGCDGGHMTACTHAGILTQMKGKQYSPQWKEAVKLFQKACDAKEDRACFNLGSLKYKEGRQKAAIKYFTLACDMGNRLACDNKARLEN